MEGGLIIWAHREKTKWEIADIQPNNSFCYSCMFKKINLEKLDF